MTGQPYAYTGDDPVNGVDPDGDGLIPCSDLPFGCGELNALASGTLSAVSCLQSGSCGSPRALANIGAGFANSAAQFADGAICGDSGVCPSWSVSAPYPCSASGSYQLGEGLFFGVGFAIPGIDEADAAGVAATAERATSALPALTGTLADSFEGGSYATQTFKAGTVFYRAEGADQRIGSFFGLEDPATAADADKMYNIAKWNNDADVVTTYRLNQDTSMYVGDVAGGTGQQALLPRGVSASSVFEQVGQRTLP